MPSASPPEPRSRRALSCARASGASPSARPRLRALPPHAAGRRDGLPLRRGDRLRAVPAAAAANAPERSELVHSPEHERAVQRPSAQRPVESPAGRGPRRASPSRSTAPARRSSSTSRTSRTIRSSRDHYLKDWRLTRVDSYGRGAGARFKIDAPLAPLRLGRHDAHRGRARRSEIVAVGRGGKFNRNKTWTTWTLEPAGGGTRVEFTSETEPALPTDRFIEAFGFRRWFKRKSGKGLRRLQRSSRTTSDRGTRATVAGI